MEKIATKQYRVIKAGFFHEWVYVENNSRYLAEPCMRKKVTDIKFRNCKKPDILNSYRVETKGKTFRLFSIDFNHPSQTMYVITIDERIYYYNFCSIFAPASSAWETLTEVYFYKHNSQMSWIWASVNPAKCFHIFQNEESEIEFNRVKDPELLRQKIENLYYHY